LEQSEQAASSLFQAASTVEQSEHDKFHRNFKEIDATDGSLFHVPRPKGGTVEQAAVPELDEAESEALAVELGKVPETFAQAFAAIQAHPPADVARGRWNAFINDAGLFLDAWGKHANRLGWTVEDLFGLHPTAGLRRHDQAGLCWLLKGERVIALTANEARLSGGLTYYSSTSHDARMARRQHGGSAE
jgi:hypothetical protein